MLIPIPDWSYYFWLRWYVDIVICLEALVVAACSRREPCCRSLVPSGDTEILQCLAQQKWGPGPVASRSRADKLRWGWARLQLWLQETSRRAAGLAAHTNGLCLLGSSKGWPKPRLGSSANPSMLHWDGVLCSSQKYALIVHVNRWRKAAGSESWEIKGKGKSAQG